jgi:hypothetical protein
MIMRRCLRSKSARATCFLVSRGGAFCLATRLTPDLQPIRLTIWSFIHDPDQDTANYFILTCGLLGESRNNLTSSDGNEGKKRHVSGSLHLFRHQTLVPCAITGLSTGSDFPGFVHETFEQFIFFVIYFQALIPTKLAISRSPPEASTSGKS